MLLKLIELKNFRQYVNSKIVFSTDRDKNITLVTGKMGYGKTTLEQAFRYVLYGIAEFQNIELLNNVVKQKMDNNSIETASVNILFEFKEKLYSLTRSQKYQKIEDDKLKPQDAKLEMYEIVNGNYVPVKDESAYTILKQVIPEQLSDYFFADGEKIEKMSKNMKDASKQDDFAKVVKSLLGLNYLTNAGKHLRRITRDYTRESAKLSGEHTAAVDQDIEKLNIEKIQLEQDIDDYKKEVDAYSKKQIQLEQEIRRIPKAQDLQQNYEDYRGLLKSEKKFIENKKDDYIDSFNKQMIQYFANPLIKKSWNELNIREPLTFGVPDLSINTINHLIKSEKCLCGSELKEGCDSFENIQKLVENLSTIQLEVSISDFLNELKSKQSAKDSFDILKSKYKSIRESELEINRIEEKIYDIEENLKDIQQVRSKKEEYDFLINTIEETQDKINSNYKQLGVVNSNLIDLEEELSTLLRKTEANKKNEKYSQYAQHLEKIIKKEYDEREEVIREKLQSKMNMNLKKMYRDGFKVEIDSRYRMKITVAGALEKDNLDKSTGQGFMIVFAFIASLVELAKEKFMDKQNQGIYIGTDEYPLVFDAPLSNIDEEYIPRFAEVITNIARQTVVFLNEKDSKLFQRAVRNKIGKEYELISSDENQQLITEIKEIL